MRITKVIATATAIAALSTSAFAGGLSDQIMEAPVVVEEEMAPAGTSVSPALIVVGILGLLILAGSADGGETEPAPMIDRYPGSQDLNR